MWKHAARWFRWAGIFAVGVFSWLGTLHAETHEAWDFENVAIGGLPTGWQAEATNPKGRLETWEVVVDPSAPSPDHVLAMTRPGESGLFGHRGELFNLCWTRSAMFRDGRIQVRFKAVSGSEDQGGGIMWRVRDKDNYYVARFNPLEDNFRLYSVHDGRRRTLAGARIALPAGKWHSMTIVQHGDHYAGYLNGKKLLEGESALFPEAGGVGVWTKADAVTEFDDFSVSTR